jgi:uncharacterized membrane protein YGL010W
MSLLNLYDQIGFYSEYHHHPVNKWIHIICVPIILFTSQVVITYYTGPLTSALSFLPVPANWAFFLTLFYAVYYIILEPVAGVSILVIFVVNLKSYWKLHCYLDYCILQMCLLPMFQIQFLLL